MKNLLSLTPIVLSSTTTMSDFDLEKAINANLESDSEEWIAGIAINAAHRIAHRLMVRLL